MGIASRIEDAEFLWKANRKEGAFLSALVAVAAAAKSKYPTLRDREGSEWFLGERDCFKRIQVEYRGTIHKVEHIFYKWMRCEHVHDGGLPTDIEFIPGERGSVGIRAGGAPEFVLRLSESWFDELVAAVTEARAHRAV